MIAMSKYILQSRVSEFNFNNCKAEMIPAVKICDTYKFESNALGVDVGVEKNIRMCLRPWNLILVVVKFFCVTPKNIFFWIF
jgi:hypothetical protein